MSQKHDIPAHVEGIIYKITCSATNKSYVGQTLTHHWNHGAWRPYGIGRRLGGHLSAARAGRTQLICAAIREHGEAAFTIVELFRCPLGERDEKEKQAMLDENTLYPLGYNQSLQGTVVPTGFIRGTIQTTQKEAKRKRTYSAAFVASAPDVPSQDDDNDVIANDAAVNDDNPEPVLRAHIREVGGMAPKFYVFFETATHKTQRTMRQTTFSAVGKREIGLRAAEDFARQYTQNIEFVANQEGESRSTQQRKKILATLAGGVLTSVRVSRVVKTIFVRFDAEPPTTLSTSFQDNKHNDDPKQTLAAAHAWITTNFPNTPIIEVGQALQQIK